MPCVKSVSVNQLYGEIPKHLGNISTLISISLENNNFSGSVPAELGNLTNLQSLLLSANNLTGPFPSLTGLKNMNAFRISSNNFNGHVPDFIWSWDKLQVLEIQGAGFTGPLPDSISNLNGLVELVLRNCNISGFIPEDINVNMPNLQTLDLSFNSLTGNLPIGFKSIGTLDSMFLTNNFINGTISDWIKTTSSMNLYRSSSRQISKPLAVYPRNLPCTQARYSSHINCGGKNITIRNITYQGDEEAGGAAKYIPTKEEWGFSSSGSLEFFGSLSMTSANYIIRNVTTLNLSANDKDSTQLYTEARTSGTSLTYYGRCLAEGNYNVTLHFAEIIFTRDKTFSSLGTRMFDVYIQEHLKLKDFDIEEAANGTGRAIEKNFPHIQVSETGTIEIRFYYAGKGSITAPNRGVNGPLISAISVVAEFSRPNKKKTTYLLIASAASLSVLMFIGYGAFAWRRRRKEREAREEVLRGLDLQTGLFTLAQIEAATNSFDAANVIGEGGFGVVYKGTLSDGTLIAVKKLSSRSSQGNKEFVTEIGMISGLLHPNLVRLHGCCIEGSQLLLIYEYMVNNNLAAALFESSPSRLDWPARQRICIGIARGLVFLHEESHLKMVHRDIKPTNVLLDEQLNAKLSDFGLARLRDDEETHINTRVAGTVGYMAPEYALWGYLTHKADVYSFGVVALEIVAGRSNRSFQRDDQHFSLLDQAFVLQKKGRVMEMALLCTNSSPILRPMMSEVVRMLEGDVVVEESAIDPTFYDWMVAQASSRERDRMESEDRNVSETWSLIHSSS